MPTIKNFERVSQYKQNIIMFKLGERSKKRLTGVNLLLVDCLEIALSKSKYDMTVPWMGGVRTAAEQNNIFKEGNSKCDGYKVLSYHQSGNALDVIPVQGGYDNVKAMNYFAQLMFDTWNDMQYTDEYNLHWGGFWGAKGWDKPHFELRKKE